MMTRGFELKNERVFGSCKIMESESSLLAVAKKEIILPSEKKIILLDEANENEKAIINSITRGGIIL